jgi:hypothetical protein
VSSHPLSSLSPPLPPLPSPRVLPSSPLRARAPSGAAPWHLPGAAPGPPARLPWPPGAAPGRPRRGSLAPPPPRRSPLAPDAAPSVPPQRDPSPPTPRRGRPGPRRRGSRCPSRAAPCPLARGPRRRGFPDPCARMSRSLRAAPRPPARALARFAWPRAPSVRTTRSRVRSPTRAVIDFWF